MRQDVQQVDLMRKSAPESKIASVCLLVFLSCWCVAVPRASAAPASSAAFDAANSLYEQGKFAEAAAAYQQMLSKGAGSPTIYFNLGNAYYKAGELGRAVASYRAAQELTPRDPDVRANLRFARGRVQGPSIEPPGWQQWLGKLSLNEWGWLAMAAVWVWLLLLAVRQVRLGWRPGLKPYVSITGLAALVLCAGLGFTLHAEHFSPSAIVIVRDAKVRQAPLEESQSAFTVHDGCELKVLDTKNNWLQVSIDSNRFGWVLRDEVLLLPGY